MKWIKKILGFKTPLEKKQSQLTILQNKAFQAQRNGDLRLAGKYYQEAEVLETEIVKMSSAAENEGR